MGSLLLSAFVAISIWHDFPIPSPKVALIEEQESIPPLISENIAICRHSIDIESSSFGLNFPNTIIVEYRSVRLIEVVGKSWWHVGATVSFYFTFWRVWQLDVQGLIINPSMAPNYHLLRWGLPKVVNLNISHILGVTSVYTDGCAMKISPGLSLANASRVVSHNFRLGGHMLSSNQGFPNQYHYSNSENCHDPLCERIARVNKRPDQPIPMSTYLAAIGVAIAIGGLIAFVIGLIVKPKNNV